MFGGIQPAIPGFKEIGKYNPAFWPRGHGPLPVLDMAKSK
jgi:hypothetical protein